MANARHRCDLCGLPMASEGATGYCSERCLMWDFFGVPALKEDALVKEIRANQNGSPRKDSVRAYPGLMTPGQEQTLAHLLGQLKITCDELRRYE